jgi:F-type H+-transporting ATPase subunit delta
MNSNREAKKSARSLFRACFTDGVLDPGRVRAVIGALAERRPRGCLAIFQQLSRLVRLELARRHVVIESATSLGESDLGDLRADIIRAHGNDLTFDVVIQPDLIGGLRVRVGSDVWDGSVRARIEKLPV